MYVDTSHRPSQEMLKSHHLKKLGIILRYNNASGNISTDTVSSNSGGTATTSTGTLLHAPELERTNSGATCDESPILSPDTVFAGQSGTRLPMDAQAGYYFVPGPSSLGARPNTMPGHNESKLIISMDSHISIFGPHAGDELSGNPRLQDVRSARATERGSIPRSEKEKAQFLPLLVDLPNYPTQPGLDKGLNKINKRIARAKIDRDHRHAQIHEAKTASSIHPAFRQAKPHPAVHFDQLTDMQAEVERISAHLKALEESILSKHHHLGEAIKCLYINQDRLVGGWEQMRKELLDIKISQAKLRQNMAVKSDSGDPAMQSTAPSASSIGTVIYLLAVGAEPAPQCEDAEITTEDKLSPPNTPLVGDPVARPLAKASGVHALIADGFMHDTSSKDGTAQHVHQYPRGCRWSWCQICRVGGVTHHF